MTPIHLVLRTEHRSSRCYGSWEMLHFSLSLMNRLNKTGSAIFILYFGLVALEWSTFHPNFYVQCFGYERQGLYCISRWIILILPMFRLFVRVHLLLVNKHLTSVVHVFLRSENTWKIAYGWIKNISKFVFLPLFYDTKISTR